MKGEKIKSNKYVITEYTSAVLYKYSRLVLYFLKKLSRISSPQLKYNKNIDIEIKKLDKIYNTLFDFLKNHNQKNGEIIIRVIKIAKNQIKNILIFL